MARANYDIRDKVVFITGAARGIGAEAARRLAAKGAKLALVGLEPEKLSELAESLDAETLTYEVDVRDMQGLQAAAAATVERFGGIDVLIANAGIAPVGSVLEIDPEDFERTIDVNLLGVWRTVRATLSHVIERQGYILAIASLAAAMHPPNMAHYCAAKAGVEAFADSLRAEVGKTGTAVGVTYFSFIDTDMVRDSFAHPIAQKQNEKTPEFLRKVYPLSDAGKAIERGIERRARRIVVPRAAILPVMASAPLQDLMDFALRRS